MKHPYVIEDAAYSAAEAMPTSTADTAIKRRGRPHPPSTAGARAPTAARTAERRTRPVPPETREEKAARIAERKAYLKERRDAGYRWPPFSKTQDPRLEKPRQPEVTYNPNNRESTVKSIKRLFQWCVECEHIRDPTFDPFRELMAREIFYIKHHREIWRGNGIVTILRRVIEAAEGLYIPEEPEEMEDAAT